jgi:hypothetical protein
LRWIPGFVEIPVGGSYTAGSGVVTPPPPPSDRRLKKNIVNSTVGLEKITAIQVCNYEFRLPEEVDAELRPTDAVKKSGVQVGAIAQELQQILPECVTQASTGVLSVHTENLTWYLITAVKELAAEVAELKSQRT